MIDYNIRSYDQELLDGKDIPYDDIVQNLCELNFINAALGGHAITIDGFKHLAGKKKEIFICEIGCGGGDNLKAIRKYCLEKNINVTLWGIDINAACTRFAAANCKGDAYQFITSNYKDVVFKIKPDIIFSSLFCHHFREDFLVNMLGWMKANARIGFFVNDLHRHPVAYHFIRIATSIFSRSYLVKNDAPLSVLRGFRKSEWKVLLQEAGIQPYTITWKWAFRFLIIHKSSSLQNRSA